ncbi:MAG: hypothetical protein KTR15_07430 [Phycisphaeraceae bacterium]|nr:hypothetical protein [Phycisphaeraceae bacterium]
MAKHSINNTELQDRIELQVFIEFASQCPLPLLPGKVEKRSPPEPDLLVPLSTGSSIAFELVSANDAAGERRFRDSFAINDALLKAYRKAVDSGSIAPPHDWGGLSVLIVMDEQASRMSKINAAQRAIEILSDMGATLQRLHFSDKYPIKKIVISKNPCADWEQQKPSITVNSAGYVGVPLVPRIESKLDKAPKYQSSHPIHLLAHARSTFIPKWEEGLDALLETHPNTSCYEAVWVYDEADKSVVYASLDRGW